MVDWRTWEAHDPATLVQRRIGFLVLFYHLHPGHQQTPVAKHLKHLAPLAFISPRQHDHIVVADNFVLRHL